MLGTTALMCFNETVSVPWAVWKWLEFYKHESCGKCTPCREGTYWLVQILRRIVAGQGTLEDLDTMLDACDNIAGRSFCALGDAAATPDTCPASSTSGPSSTTWSPVARRRSSSPRHARGSPLMTQVARHHATTAPEPEPVPEGHVRLTIDGVSVDRPQG